MNVVNDRINTPATRVAQIHSKVNGKTLAAALVTVVFWSSAFAGIRAGLTAYNPYQLTLFRFLVASLAFAIYAACARIPLPRPADLPRLLLTGLAGITCYHLLLNIGQQSVPAAAASLIISASPVFTALLSRLIRQEHLSVCQWSGMALGFGGIAFMVIGNGETLHFGVGALYVLGAAICSAIFFILQKSLLGVYEPIRLTAYFTWLGTLPLLMFFPGLLEAIDTAPWQASVAAVYIGLFPAAVAYVSWGIALAALPAARAASFLYLSPPLAAIIAWIWLHETPGLPDLLGGAAVLAGVVMVNRRITPPAAPQPSPLRPPV